MSDEKLIVKCSLGSVQGTVYPIVDGGNIYAFLGVPYGKPPIGDLRFKDPVPIEPWTGIKSAVHPPPAAMTIIVTDTGEAVIPPGNDEDCLYLNVYTPELPNPNAKLPVMVYIHGGGFTMGTGNPDFCGPDYLVPNGIILVTINYRLGAFGFLSLQTPDCPGNYGLKDQSLGLRWVKNNISAFGGDPDNVTLFGESAGSASVQYQMISKNSRGLFNRVIAQSGFATNRWAYSRFPKESGLLLASKIAGKDVTTAEEALKIVKNAPARDILLHSETIFQEIEGQWAGEQVCKFAFVPTAEPPNTPNPFLSKHPQQAFNDGDCVDVPNIIGVCSHEAIFVLPSADYVPDASNLTDFEKLLPKETGVKLGSEQAAAAAKKIIEFYFPNGVNQECYVNASSDTLMTYTITKGVLDLAKKQKSPIYFYVFAGGRNPSMIKNIFGLQNVQGTCHADDIEYLFTGTHAIMPFSPIEKESKEEVTKNLMTKIWTDFAKTGKIPSEWKPVKHPNNDYVEITDKIVAKQGFYADVIKFWDEIYAFLSK